MLLDVPLSMKWIKQWSLNGNLIHKTIDDPRFTLLGCLLYYLSLKELPQLFNDFEGTISLVDPRPEIPYLAERYEPRQHKHFEVLPGITGWWQVNSRSDKLMHLHIEDDFYYIQNYSI